MNETEVLGGYFIKTMLEKTPSGILKDTLSSLSREVLPRPAIKRIFLLTLYRSSRQFSYRGYSFAYENLTDDIKEYGIKLGIEPFENNRAYLEKIRPVYEAVFRTKLSDSKPIQSIEKFSKNELQCIISDFVIFGFNFSSWHSSPQSYIDFLKLENILNQINRKIRLTGGFADQHLFEGNQLLELLQKNIDIYNEQSKLLNFRQPPEIFFKGHLANAASFDIDMVANEDSEEIICREQDFLKEVCLSDQKHTSDDLRKKYGKKSIRLINGILNILESNNLNISFEHSLSSISPLKLNYGDVSKGNKYIKSILTEEENYAYYGEVDHRSRIFPNLFPSKLPATSLFAYQLS